MMKVLSKAGKPLIAWLLTAVVLAAFMPVMTISALGEPTPDTDWYDNSPGASDFTLTTADQLAGLAVLVNNGTDDFDGKTITLSNDIDLIAYGSAYNGGLGWEPIGGESGSFKGIFEGAGYKINSLYIDNSLNYGSLFGKTTGASVLNLGLENVSISSVNYTGALIGMSLQTTIENCYASGTVSGGTITGGLIGYAQDRDTISSCYFSGAVDGDTYVGGLIGNAGNGVEVTNCYTTGSVDGASRYTGGLIGWLYMYESSQSGPSMKNCFSTSSVSGDDGVGGLVGSLIDGLDGGIANCAALNSTISGNSNVNRIAGSRSENVFLCYNVALTNISSGSGVVFGGANTHDGLGGADISDEQAKSREFWSITTPSWMAWDSDVWKFSDGALPTLKMSYTPVGGGPLLVANTANGEPGDEVEITVSLKNNPGIAGFSLTLGYDPDVLTPVSVAENGALGGSVFASNVNEASDKSALGGVITAVWAAGQDVSEETLFTARLKINNISINTGENVVTPVSVYVNELKQLDRQDVTASVKNGSVTVSLADDGVTTDLWGDVNVDDDVNVYDLIRFAKHLAAVPAEKLVDRGLYLADVDRSSSVDLGDLILITRYLLSADMDNPDVILGKQQ